MIELRCRFKKAAEVDPATLRIVYRCPTCSKAQKREVLHEWPISMLLDAISNGQECGVISPVGAEVMV